MNAQAKHTPGPWSWNRMPNRFRLLSAKGEESGLAVRILVAEDEVWPDHPNALLIAAAPEMAEAMLAILALYKEDPDDLETMDAGIKLMEPALRKAGLLS